MKCPAPMELDQFVQGELSAKSSMSVHLHLSTCATCSAEVATLSAERRALVARARSRQPPPPNLLWKVELTLRQASRDVSRPSSRWSLAPLVMTAMAALLFFALLPARPVQDDSQLLTASVSSPLTIHESRETESFTRMPNSDREISATEASFAACLKATPCSGGPCINLCGN